MIKWRKPKVVQYDSLDEEKLLRRGWEPFAVSNNGIKVWYRKLVKSRGKNESD